MINKSMIPTSAPVTFGFSNCVTPKGAMRKGRRKSKENTINESTILNIRLIIAYVRLAFVGNEASIVRRLR